MTTGDGKVIDSIDEIDAIGHRVVHGGEKFKKSCLITPEVISAIRDLSSLAPLHNPAAILGIEASYKVFGDKPNIAVFDTAFHSTMPPKAYMYAIPYEYYEKYGVRPLRLPRHQPQVCQPPRRRVPGGADRAPEADHSATWATAAPSPPLTRAAWWTPPWA